MSKRFLVFAVLLTGCAKEARQAPMDVSNGIAAALTERPDSVIVMSRLTDFPWTRMYVFGPYTPAQTIRDSIGAGCCGGAEDILASADDHDLLVFIRPGNTPLVERHPRDRGEFGPEAVGKGYSKAEAVFMATLGPADGWKILVQVLGRS
jgi:hypothetical protein